MRHDHKEDHTLEELIFRKSEIQELVCPRCGATQVSQQMSSFACNTSEGHSGGGGVPPSCGSGGFS